MMRRRAGGWIVAVTLLFASLLGHASDLQLDTTQSFWLSHYADVYEDVDGNLTLDEVRHRPFVHNHGNDHNFGFTNSVYWFRWTVHPALESLYREWWLRIYYPLLDDIRVYGVDAQNGELMFEKVSGDLHPFEEREVAHLNFLFFIPLTTEPMTLYVRVKTESSMQVPMVLQTSKDVIEEDQRTILITGLYYGLFVVIFLYNVIMYFYTRERTYLFYLFFISTFVTWQLTLNGIGQQYLWDGWEWMQVHGAPVLTSVAAVSALLFGKHFLQTARFTPWLNRLIIVLTLLSGVAVFFSSWIAYRTAMLMSVGLALVVPVVLLVSGIVVWYHKFRPARFYVLGWSSFLLGTVVIALNKYGVFHGYLFYQHAQQLGSALEMIFLSWALADRIKMMQDEYVDKLSTLNDTLQQKVSQSLEKEREKDKMLIRQSRHAAMGEMIEQIAHQWRQPLNTMALIMQDLYFKVKLHTFEEAHFDKANEQISENLQYMSKTIDDFRNFHQFDKEAESIAVESVIEMALALNEAMLRYAGIAVEMRSQRPHVAYVAKNELVQVFMNLIKNARDAIAEHGGTQRRITIDVDEDETAVRIAVEDTGGGIPEVIMGRVFDPYFTTKQHNKGTGLGLYMSRSIVEESMGGSLSVENSDTGARFILNIPKARRKSSGASEHTQGSDHL